MNGIETQMKVIYVEKNHSYESGNSMSISLFFSIWHLYDKESENLYDNR